MTMKCAGRSARGCWGAACVLRPAHPPQPSVPVPFWSTKKKARDPSTPGPAGVRECRLESPHSGVSQGNGRPYGDTLKRPRRDTITRRCVAPRLKVQLPFARPNPMPEGWNRSHRDDPVTRTPYAPPLSRAHLVTVSRPARTRMRMESADTISRVTLFLAMAVVRARKWAAARSYAARSTARRSSGRCSLGMAIPVTAATRATARSNSTRVNPRVMCPILQPVGRTLGTDSRPPNHLLADWRTVSCWIAVCSPAVSRSVLCGPP